MHRLRRFRTVFLLSIVVVDVRFGIIRSVGMVMGGFILTVDVGMGVAMFMDMGVYQIPVPVLVGMHMGMFMGMLQGDGILDHQNRCEDHDDEAHIEPDTGTLIQQQNEVNAFSCRYITSSKY